MDTIKRRTFSQGLAVLLGLPLFRRAAGQPDQAQATGGDGLTATHEAIHQEVPIDATPARVYHALTDAAEFTRMTAFSMVKDAPPAGIAKAAGGAFSLFGGRIVGRHIELVPNERVVQAWRAANWPAGVYSVARFALKPAGAGTTIIFDHTGFPDGQGGHLSQGWSANYWEPMRHLMTTR